MEEDNVDEEGGGTQVGLPNVFLCATLTKYHVQFTSQTVTFPFLFLPGGCCAPGYTDTCFSFPFLLVTLTDAMRSSDVSSSRDCGHCLITCHRFAYSFSLCHAYVFSLMLLTHSGYVDSSHVPDFVTPMYLPDDSSLVSSRFFLRPVFYPPFCLLVHLPDWTIFLSCTFMGSTPLCTCIYSPSIYNRLEMGRSPSSIYFATTLKL